MRQSILLKVFFVFFGCYLVFILIRSVASSSIIFSKRDRITVVFYNERPSFISLGLADSVNYIGFFDNGASVYVPGGYGRYKIGSLGRLSDLEKNSAIYQKAFSSVLSAYVDFYYYPKTPAIYSFDRQYQPDRYPIPKLSLADVFIKLNYNTNAGFIDRLFLFLNISNKKRAAFSLVATEKSENKEGERVFQEDRFGKKYQGYFYQSSLRDERKEVQILYKTYKSALLLTRIIEGEGIRVVDLSEIEKTPQTCIIHENSQTRSATAFFLQNIFDCGWQHKRVETADIALLLGEKLEREWGE